MAKTSKREKKLAWLEEGIKSWCFRSLEEAQVWIERQETQRVENGEYTQPDTKFVFEKFISVQIKVILDNQPLQVGEGRYNTTCGAPDNWRRTSLPHMTFQMKR